MYSFSWRELCSFSDIFFIDTSTTATIETGLKAIATSKNVGNTPQSALEWLKSKQNDWLIFFNNADDPKINLNDFLPQCKHGNVIITSRNPGLCVYAGSNSLISEMEKLDATELLLKSATLDSTESNRKSASDIVQVGFESNQQLITLKPFLGIMLSASCYHPSWCIHLQVSEYWKLSGPLCTESSSIA